MKNENYFDKTQEYNDEILDLVTKLKIACNQNRMPLFVSVCVKNTEDDTFYKNDMVGAASSNIKLTNDKFPDFVNIINGFKTYLPMENSDTWNVEVETEIEDF